MRAAELLSELLLIGSRLQRTRNNEYYLVVPVVGGEIARKTPAKNSSSSILGGKLQCKVTTLVRLWPKITNNASASVERLKHRGRMFQSKLAKLRSHKKRQNHRKASNARQQQDSKY